MTKRIGWRNVKPRWKTNSEADFSAGIAPSIDDQPDAFVSVSKHTPIKLGIINGVAGVSVPFIHLTAAQARHLSTLLLEAAAIADIADEAQS
jgi:hypothetical protein